MAQFFAFLRQRFFDCQLGFLQFVVGLVKNVKNRNAFVGSSWTQVEVVLLMFVAQKEVYLEPPCSCPWPGQGSPSVRRWGRTGVAPHPLDLASRTVSATHELPPYLKSYMNLMPIYQIDISQDSTCLNST